MGWPLSPRRCLTSGAFRRGERQRAALARAVIQSPEVIIADEPTGNLDWEMSLRLLTLLIELNRMGKTVVIATHDLNLIRSVKAQVQARVLRIQNRRLHLAGGRICECDRAVEIRNCDGCARLGSGGAADGGVHRAADGDDLRRDGVSRGVCTGALDGIGGRLADRWSEALARSATIRISAPADQMTTQVQAVLATLASTPGCREFPRARNR